MSLYTFDENGELLVHATVGKYRDVGYEIPGHKYKWRIRNPITGKYRYFYTDAEIKAYERNQKVDRQYKAEGRSRPTFGRTEQRKTLKKDSAYKKEGRERPDSYYGNVTKVSVTMPSNVREGKQQYKSAKEEEYEVHKEYGYIDPKGKTQMIASPSDYDIIRKAEATTKMTKNLLDEEKKKRQSKVLQKTVWNH